MPKTEIELRPVDHITTDAIGPPGKRVFYLHGWKGDRTVTLIIEKIQIQSLAVGMEQFLAEIQEKFPNIEEASADYQEGQMHISPPVDPLFRVGEIGLGYEEENDLIVLVVQELLQESMSEEERSIVRYWCSRDQLRALARWGMELASRGRPTCPQCGQPMDPEGHFCPRKNGHKH